MMPTPVGFSMRPMEICSPCPRPCDQGPVYLQFLVKRNEEAFEQQVEAFTLGLDSVLQDLGKLPEATLHVVGVDSDETRFVLEVIIDGCQSQSSRAIFDTVEKLADEEKDKLPAEKQAVESTFQSEPKLPHPWQQHVSSRTGKFYWYNPDTKETTWICPTPKVAPAGGRLGDSVCVHVFRGHRVRVCACEPSRQGVDSKTQCSAQMRLLHLNASGYRVSARGAGARAQGVSTRQVTLRSTSR